ncbi:MAG: manganese efflux pump [Clostridia bacterium]|nr:manganese efflux pump [Clostridia bacterium]
MLSFLVTAISLGIGLAMDAFSVSMANAMIENNMKKRRMSFIAGVYAAFQFLMPLLGYFAVRFAAEKFEAFERAIPYIALLLLLYIGGKMLIDGIKKRDEEAVKVLDTKTLLMQGVATSIDALSVGFTISAYSANDAVLASAIIALVTFIICFTGLIIGKKFGHLLKNKAHILGGIILIAIGIEIFIKGVFL